MLLLQIIQKCFYSLKKRLCSTIKLHISEKKALFFWLTVFFSSLSLRVNIIITFSIKRIDFQPESYRQNKIRSESWICSLASNPCKVHLIAGDIIVSIHTRVLVCLHFHHKWNSANHVRIGAEKYWNHFYRKASEMRLLASESSESIQAKHS